MRSSTPATCPPEAFSVTVKGDLTGDLVNSKPLVAVRDATRGFAIIDIDKASCTYTLHTQIRIPKHHGGGEITRTCNTVRRVALEGKINWDEIEAAYGTKTLSDDAPTHKLAESLAHLIAEALMPRIKEKAVQLVTDTVTANAQRGDRLYAQRAIQAGIWASSNRVFEGIRTEVCHMLTSAFRKGQTTIDSEWTRGI